MLNKTRVALELRIKTLFFTLLLLVGWQKSDGQDQTYIDSVRTHIDYGSTRAEKFKAYDALIDYYRRFDLNKSQELIVEAMNDIAGTQKDTIKAFLLLHQANTYFYRSNLNDALQSALSAEMLFREKEHESGCIKALNTIGNIYDRLGDYQSSMQYYLKCLNMMNQAQETQPQILLYKPTLFNNIACAYLRLDNTEEARQYFERGIEIAEQSNNEMGLANIYNNLGRYHQLFNDNVKTRQHFEEAIQLRTKLEDWNGLAKSYFYLSSFFFDRQMYDSAQWAAQQSIDFAHRVGAIESEDFAYYHLYQAQRAAGNYEAALEAFEMHKTLSDSILNTNKVNEVMATRLRFEKEELEQSLVINEQKMQLKYFSIIGGLAIFVLIALSMLYRSKYQKNKLAGEKEQLENELDSKNRELTTNVMYMVRKNELITQIAKKLLALKESLKPENEKAVREIILDLQSEVDREVWQEFETRFHQVHSSFYQNLLKAHPDLTPAEERLSAFLRLNMTTKEIAAITHQGIKSLEVARARLRKKFNITGTDTNLISYLEQF